MDPRLRSDPRRDLTDPPSPAAPRDLARAYADLALEVRGLLREIHEDVAACRTTSEAARDAAYEALRKLGAFDVLVKSRFEALEKRAPSRTAIDLAGPDTQTFLLEQLEQRDLAKEAKAMRALKGGAWHVTLAVCVAIALALLGLFGAALLSQTHPLPLSSH
jgi:hypothetical protein